MIPPPVARETRANRSPSAGESFVSPCNPVRVVFAVWVVAYLALVWSFRYLPTYDGPLHLASAVTWAGFDEPHTRYREFYVFEPKQVPNLTSQLLLAGLVRLVHPLIAEKVLVSIYIIGLATAFLYYVTALNRDALLLAPLGLLFVFHRAFFVGLYNYCLSLIAFWCVAGYCLRRSSGLRVFDVLTLAGVLILAYCTHLVGWALSVAAVFCLAAYPRGHRFQSLCYLAAGAAPSFMLAVHYGNQTSMAGPGGVLAVIGQALSALNLAELIERLATLGENIFGPLAPPVDAYGFAVFLCCEVMIAAAILCQRDRGRATSPKHALAMAIVLLIGYFVLPDKVGRHGGLLVMRLAFLPPMVLIGLLRLPKVRVGRYILLALVYSMLLVNLAATAHFFYRANSDIEEYVAGIGAIGKNASIFTVAPPDGSYWPGHLRHAAGYYCLTTGNIALENFQGAPGPFWLHFRPGIDVCQGDFEHYRNKSRVDYLLVWDDPSYGFRVPAGCREVFSEGRLHVFANHANALYESFLETSPAGIAGSL